MPRRKKRSRSKTAEECPVCLDIIEEDKDTAVTPCGHRFHLTCLYKSFTNGTAQCPLCRGHIIEPEEAPPASDDDTDEEEGHSHYVAILDRAIQNHRNLMLLLENDAAWTWTTFKEGWVEAAGMYVEFLRHVAHNPEHVYLGPIGGAGGSTALLMEDFHSLAIDSLETISSDRYELFCHPEFLLLKTAFGPAFCDGYTMHQRYVYFLRTMSRVVEYFSDRMGDQQAIEDFPMCHLLSGRLVKMFAGT